MAKSHTSSEYSRQYNLTHKKERRAYNKIYCKRVREEVLTHYSDGIPRCACCGETHLEFLCVDHIEGGGNEHRRALGLGRCGGFVFYRWLINQGYPEGYQILCYNCNQSYGSYGYCPHERELYGK